MARRSGWRGTAAAVLVAGLAVAGCTSSVAGTAGPVRFDISSVAGLPIYDGDNGLRPNVQPADLPVEDSTGEGVDLIATDAIADVQEYWSQVYPEVFDGKAFSPVEKVVSYDSRLPPSQASEVCGENTSDYVNAFYCTDDNTIAWDRGRLLPLIQDTFTDMGVVLVLAHEYGHSVQDQADLNDRRTTPTIVLEQQADCFAGTYLRHVAEGKSNYFVLDTAQGLNDVLAASVAVRDSVGSDPLEDGAHGSAFDRVTAVSFGFTDGPSKCTTITEDEVEQRISALPTELSSASDTGDIAVDDRSIGLIVDSLAQVFPAAGGAAVQVDLGGADRACADAQATPPVSYCPADRTLAVDVPALAEIGTPSQDSSARSTLPSVVTGDFSAFVLVAARYVLAVQQEQGVRLDDALTGLRSVCLAGSWATATSSGGDLQLSPGDLDEAVSGLLQSSLGASDVNGTAVRSGFARVEAFRTGVLDGQDACFSIYV